MATQELLGKKVAVLAANGFTERDMTEIQRSLLSTGAVMKIISTEQGLVNSWNGTGWGHCFPVDAHIGETLSVDFDLLVVPGGERSITKLKSNPHTERIISGFLEAKKPVAVLSDAVDVISQSEMVSEITVTGSDVSKEIITAAGGLWADAEIFVDGAVMSGVTTEDDQITSYIARMITFFAGQEDQIEIKQAA